MTVHIYAADFQPAALQDPWNIDTALEQIRALLALLAAAGVTLY